MENQMTKKDYAAYVERKAKKSNLPLDIVKAFVVGGFICCIGQFIGDLAMYFGFSEENAATATSMSLVAIAAILTGLNVFDEIGRFAGAGSSVPITGFSNSMVSPAIEFKSEGLVMGVGAKMFVVAGPVLVYGVTASIIYGIIYFLFTR